MPNSFFLLFILFFTATFHLQGKSAFVVSERNELLDIGAETYFLVDEESKFSLEDVVKKEVFDKKGESITVFGTTNATVWTKFRLKNNTNSKIILSLGDPTIDTVELYYKSGDQFICKKTGDNLPFFDREASTAAFLFELDLPPGEEKEYYLKLRSGEPLLITLKAGTYLGLLEFNQKNDLVHGLYFGFMLLVILYNFFLFWGIKDWMYLNYVLYAGALAFTTAYIKGYDTIFLPELAIYLNNIPAIIYSAASIFSIHFSIRFLHTRKNHPLLHKGLIVILFLNIIPIVLNLSGEVLLAIVSLQIIALIGCITLFITGILIYKNGFHPAKFYILAWTAFLAGVVMTILNDNQFISSNILTTNSIFIGSALEALLLSFALSDKINSYKEEKIKAELLTLKEARRNEILMKEQNEFLELEVRRRTAELELKNLELNKQKEELKDLNILKDKLFSIISHDLRGPLNSLHGIIGLLNKGQNPDDFAKVFDDLKSTLSTTRNLLDNVLHWAISNIKGVSGISVPVNLQETVNECIDLLKYSAKEKNIIVKNDISADLIFHSDINMIRLVLRNLVSNAIKFTPEKGTVTVSASKTGNDVIVSIQDTGVGISEENRNKLFNIKSPLSTRGTLNEKGTGIGLIICKEFLTKNNGKIWVESIEGKGSCFKFSIPVKSSKIMELEIA